MKLTKTLTSLVVLFALFTTTIKAQSAPDDITGRWINPENERVTELYKEHNAYFGKIVEDKNEKVPAGTIFLKDIEFVSTGKWKGTISAPKRNRDIPCTITMTDKDKLTITVSVMGKTKTLEWKRKS